MKSLPVFDVNDPSPGILIFTGTVGGASGWVCEAMNTDDSWGLRMVQRSVGGLYRYDEATDSFVNGGYVAGITAEIIDAAGLTGFSTLPTTVLGTDLRKTDISARLVEVL